jgi:ribosomal protein S18 acetylase RimI-like enzyme
LPGPEDEPVLCRLDPADAGEVLTLQRAAYVTEAAAHQDFGLPPLTETLDQVRAQLDDLDRVVLGLRQAGRLLGAVRLRLVGDQVELGRLTVAPDRQRAGLGTRLLLAAESVYPQARAIQLFTGEHSLSNIRLYTRLGYRPTHRTRADGYDLIHFVKPLPPNRVEALPGVVSGHHAH